MLTKKAGFIFGTGQNPYWGSIIFIYVCVCVCLDDQRICYGRVIGVYDGHPMQNKNLTWTFVPLDQPAESIAWI